MKHTFTLKAAAAGAMILSSVFGYAQNLDFKIKSVEDKTETASDQRKDPPRRISSDEVQLMGCVFGSSAGNKSGLYKFSTTAPEMEFINDKPQATGGGTAGKGRYYCQWYLTMLGMEIWANMDFNMETWEFEGATGDLENQAFDLAYDDSTDRIYGCYFDPDENYKGARLVFGYIDAADYANDYFQGMRVHPVCDLFVCFSGLAFDGQGRLFALTKEGLLLQVDKETGDMTQIGETGLAPQYNSSAAIDPATGTMYYYLCTDAATTLYAIDTETAEATALYTLPGGEEVQGLAIFNPQAADEAPAAPENISTTFIEGNLTGSVNFTIPARTYSGSPASGPVDYSVYYRPYEETEAEYTLLNSGVSQYGEAVEAPVTLPENGMYTFGIILSASDNDSPMTVTDRFVGYDTPLAPLDVVLTCGGTTINLSWRASENSLHNGYVDLANLRFIITRMPDGETVAEDYSGSSFSETLPIPETHKRYTYKVQADNHGVLSFPTESNFVGIGDFTFPYLCEFEDADEFAEYTVITKAESPDNYFKWEYHIGRQAAHVGNGRVADDDLLVTPGLAFRSGYEYEVTVVLSNNNDNHDARLAILAGSVPEREALTQTVKDLYTFNAKWPETNTLTATFVPAGDTHHIAIHALSEAESWDDLYVHSIAIEEKEESGIRTLGTSADSLPRYFTLSGIEVAEPLEGNIYIRISPEGHSKIIF